MTAAKWPLSVYDYCWLPWSPSFFAARPPVWQAPGADELAMPACVLSSVHCPRMPCAYRKICNIHVKVYCLTDSPHSLTLNVFSTHHESWTTSDGITARLSYCNNAVKLACRCLHWINCRFWCPNIQCVWKRLKPINF